LADPQDIPPFAAAAALRSGADGDRLALTIPAQHRAWARDEGDPIDDVSPSDAPNRLSIVAPEHHSRIGRHPEAPPALNRLVLKVVVEPHVPQVVWYVDGEPFAVTDPDNPVLWPIKPGTHRFQVRLPLREGLSRPVRVVVE